MSLSEIFLWILQGIGVTALVTLVSVCVAIPFGMIFGILLYETRGPILLAVKAFVEFWRSSSIPILLFFFFYALPLFGPRLSDYAVSAIVLGCNSGAYLSQALSSALRALDRGQNEAGRSLALSRLQILRLVELPQALRTIYPIMGNDLIDLIKSTSIVSVIGLADITYKAKEALQFVYKPGEIFSSLMLIYVMICYPLGLAVRRLSRRKT